MSAPLVPSFTNGLTAHSFAQPAWSEYAGESGAFVSASNCGHFEAIAQPLNGGWQFWLVRTSDGLTIQEVSCAA